LSTPSTGAASLLQELMVDLQKEYSIAFPETPGNPSITIFPSLK